MSGAPQLGPGGSFVPAALVGRLEERPKTKDGVRIARCTVMPDGMRLNARIIDPPGEHYPYKAKDLVRLQANGGDLAAGVCVVGLYKTSPDVASQGNREIWARDEDLRLVAADGAAVVEVKKDGTVKMALSRSSGPIGAIVSDTTRVEVTKDGAVEIVRSTGLGVSASVKLTTGGAIELERNDANPTSLPVTLKMTAGGAVEIAAEGDIQLASNAVIKGGIEEVALQNQVDSLQAQVDYLVRLLNGICIVETASPGNEAKLVWPPSEVLSGNTPPLPDKAPGVGVFTDFMAGAIDGYAPDDAQVIELAAGTRKKVGEDEAKAKNAKAERDNAVGP